MISTRRGIYKLIGLALGCSMMMATPSYAVPYSWVDWNAHTTSTADGTVEGISVHFAGDVALPTQLTGQLGSTDYWSVNPLTYTGGGVGNGPSTPTPNTGIIALVGPASTDSQILSFTSSVTNPVMAILSLGQSQVSNGADIFVNYKFDHQFTILNQGPGAFGASDSSLTSDSTGFILTGKEGNGIIQFNGTFDSITPIKWSISDKEFWHGFTVGIATVPEPASLILLGAGLAGIGIWRRKAAKG